MEYEEFLKGYSPELQLLEALDSLSQYSMDAAESLDLLVSGAKAYKNAEECARQDPIPKA